MANQGIDINARINNFDNIYKKIRRVNGVGKKLDLLWNKTFENKTFNSLMPQLYLDTFKNTYQKALKKGMKPELAEEFAGNTTKAFYGIFESVGRAKGTDDKMSALLFAPKFREGIIHTLWNTVKSVSTELGNPAFAKNRKLFMGMMLSYAGYNMLNKQTSGHYMWDNPPGKEFELMMPTSDGEVVYMGFMPSFLAFARNMASGGIALAKGDINTATQKFGGLFSMPVKLITELVSNRNFFGNTIYDEDATKSKQLASMAKHAGVSINHPFIREPYKWITEEKPLHQVISGMTEMPLKFSTMSKINKQKMFQSFEKKRKEEKQAKEEFRPKYEEIQKTIDNGEIVIAQQIVNDLPENEYTMYKSLKTADKKSKNREVEVEIYDRFNKVQKLISEGKNTEAQSIVDSMTKDEYEAYKRLKKKL